MAGWLPGATLANMSASPSMCTLMSYSVTPVGFMRSCFKEKFAIPRQPLLAGARGVLELVPPFDRAVAVEGLERISHVWLLFLFHQALEDKPRLKVRPPRLGGNATLGVFASRATYRPNGIGQSVVKLDRVEPGRLWLSGIDLLDGTPVLDIKPYVPFTPTRYPKPSTASPMAPPVAVPVEWSDSALDQAQAHAQRLGEPLVQLIEQCLAQDPRPAYQVPEPERRYGVLLWDAGATALPRAGAYPCSGSGAGLSGCRPPGLHPAISLAAPRPELHQGYIPPCPSPVNGRGVH